MLKFGPRREKPCLRWFANNQGADQPAHSRSLISAFVIRLLESIISKLGTRKFSIFQLVSVDEETGLRIVLSKTPKSGFVASGDKLHSVAPKCHSQVMNSHFLMISDFQLYMAAYGGSFMFPPVSNMSPKIKNRDTHVHVTKTYLFGALKTS